MKPDFKSIDIKVAAPAGKLCGCKAKKAGADEIWKTPEHIEVKPVYTKENLEGMEHLNYAAGIAPNLRGPYSTMYVMRPGPSVSMPDSPLPRRVTHSTAVTWPPVRRVCQLHLTLPPTAVTMLTTSVWLVM